jgi:uncharacterized protein (TIGR02231 family)
MKNSFLFLFLLGFNALIAQNTKEAESQITQVVVYLQGAQVTRLASVELPKGRTDVVLKGLSAKMRSNSIQVSVAEGITILSVNHSIDYLVQQPTEQRILRLIQSRDALNDSLLLLRNTQTVYTRERDMILANQNIGGSEKGVDIEQLIKASTFFRERLMEIEALNFALTHQMKEMQQRLNTLSQQLNELNAQKNRPTSTVKVSLSATRAMKAPVQISYNLYQASWEPGYDIRVSDTDHPLNLIYKAKVYQDTDEDWNNVKLTLSTGNPTVSNYKPELHPWHIDILPPPPPPAKVAGILNIVENDVELDEELLIEDAETSKRLKTRTLKAPGALRKEYVNIEQQQTSTAYNIEIPYTIPANNQGYDVSMLERQLPAQYRYAAVPKLSPHIFLMAQITDQVPSDLLPGEVNLYYQQTYQGKTYFDPLTAQDTLSLSIGREPGIIIKRELLKDLASRNFLGSTQKETRAWEITVRNTKKTDALVILEDQYPVSNTSDLKVSLDESSGAQVNETTGALNWRLNLKPGETQKVKFIYSVKFPKGKTVRLE